MSDRKHFLNTSVDNLSMEETLDKVAEAVEEDRLIHHVVVNAGKIVALQKDRQLLDSVNKADLINADGQAVVWASRLLNKPLKERVAGIDLFVNLLNWAHENKHSIYLLGAEPEVLEALVEKISRKFSKELIAGYHHGYFGKREEQGVVTQIAHSGAQLLFVAMPSPRKEIFLRRHKAALADLNFIMGVGGSFDVLAGKTRRAPRWMQNAGLEWFYRFLQEPRRMWKRYLIGNTKFVALVVGEKFKSKKSFRNQNEGVFEISKEKS